VTEDRFIRIRELFEAALAQPPASRNAFVEAACAGDMEMRNEVDRLLAAHEKTDAIVDRPAISRDVIPDLREETSPDVMSGRRFGSWKIVRELGRGGMATVYLARRADDAFRKEVALKLVAPFP
jgi:hypothetical protein